MRSRHVSHAVMRRKIAPVHLLVQITPRVLLKNYWPHSNLVRASFELGLVHMKLRCEYFLCNFISLNVLFVLLQVVALLLLNLALVSSPQGILVLLFIMDDLVERLSP